MFQSDLFPAGVQLPTVPLVYAIGARIAELLALGRHLARADISRLFAEETGGKDWGSAWTIDDYNNAVEIGALLWLRESSRIDLATSVHEAERSVPLHEALGSLLKIEAAHWWRPTAANYFDRVAKPRTFEALDAAGGPDLVSRYAASKKAELGSAAERIFSGNFIGEADVKERARAWVPSIMRFAGANEDATVNRLCGAGHQRKVWLCPGRGAD